MMISQNHLTPVTKLTIQALKMASQVLYPAYMSKKPLQALKTASQVRLPAYMIKKPLHALKMATQILLPAYNDQEVTSISIPALKELFPSASDINIQKAFDTCKDLDGMIDTLTSPQSLILDISQNPRKRLEVDEESCMESCLSFYKNSCFDPLVPLRIVFSGQTAIDAGGLLRQFFTSSGNKISEVLFEGK